MENPTDLKWLYTKFEGKQGADEGSAFKEIFCIRFRRKSLIQILVCSHMMTLQSYFGLIHLLLKLGSDWHSTGSGCLLELSPGCSIPPDWL